jgi:PAS domain-containing protein
MDEQGPAAAKLALEILSNTSPPRASLLDPDLNQLLFDWRQLQRWNVSEKRLPAGSQIRFRPSGVWEQHRTFVIAVTGVLASMTAILAALLFQISRRKKAEVSSRQSEERLKFSAASTNTGLWQYNLRTGDLWATEQCRAMFGLTPKIELKPKIFLRAVHRDDRSIIAAAIRLIRYGRKERRIPHPTPQWPNALDSRRKQNPPR